MAASKVVAFSLVLSCLAVSASAFNITDVLLGFPKFSLLNEWLTKTDVITALNNQTSVTLLAADNDVLQNSLSKIPNVYNDPSLFADTLRYHVLLEYFGYQQLKENVLANGTSVTTLLQTTGRANQTQGFVTLYNNGTNFLVGHQFVDYYGNETILANVTGLPFSYSILQVSALLTPVPPALPSPTPAPSPLTGKSPSPTPVTVPSTPTGTSPVGSTTPTIANINDCSMTSASTPLVLLAIVFASVIANALL